VEGSSWGARGTLPVNRNMGVPGASSGGKTSHVNDPMLLLGVDVGEW